MVSWRLHHWAVVSWLNRNLQTVCKNMIDYDISNIQLYILPISHYIIALRVILKTLPPLTNTDLLQYQHREASTFVIMYAITYSSHSKFQRRSCLSFGMSKWFYLTPTTYLVIQIDWSNAVRVDFLCDIETIMTSHHLFCKQSMDV